MTGLQEITATCLRAESIRRHDHGSTATVEQQHVRFCIRECRLYHTLEAVKRFAPVCEKQCWQHEPYVSADNSQLPVLK